MSPCFSCASSSRIGYGRRPLIDYDRLSRVRGHTVRRYKDAQNKQKEYGPTS